MPKPNQQRRYEAPRLLTTLQTEIVEAVEDFNDTGDMLPSLRQRCLAIGWRTSSSGSMSAKVHELIQLRVLERVGRTLRVAARSQRRHERSSDRSTAFFRLAHGTGM